MDQSNWLLVVAARRGHGYLSAPAVLRMRLPMLEDFSEIVKRQEPLAPYTFLKVGGPAEFFVQPRSVDQLTNVVQQCLKQNIPVRVLGGGCNILVSDEGVRGVVLRLSTPVFTQVVVEGRRIRAGTGAA